MTVLETAFMLMDVKLIETNDQLLFIWFTAFISSLNSKLTYSAPIVISSQIFDSHLVADEVTEKSDSPTVLKASIHSYRTETAMTADFNLQTKTNGSRSMERQFLRVCFYSALEWAELILFQILSYKSSLRV